MSAEFWIEKLDMLPHPEGGYYKETYQSTERISKKSLPKGFSGDRKIATAIYFLLEEKFFSAFHKIKSDEIWHFYEGNAIEIFYFDKENQLHQILLGNNPAKSEVFQAMVPAGCWFGSRIIGGKGYALVGCTVAPGFDFADFEMANRENLIREYPKYKDLILQLTH